MVRTAEKSVESLVNTHEFDTYLRDYNDTTTLFAEVLNGAMRTPFEYSYHSGELYASDGDAMGPIFQKSLDQAEEIAMRTPKLAFEQRRRRHEQAEYRDMLAMAKGELPNTMIVVSDFPSELKNAREDAGGYNVTRQQTMLRVIYWQDGTMHMVSQTLDGSNRTALEALYEYHGRVPAAGELLGQRTHMQLSGDEQTYLIDRLTGVYDRSLTKQYGGTWYAGRKDTRRNTYEFACKQQDLIDAYAMAHTDNERFNVIAALEARYERATGFVERTETTYRQVSELPVAALLPHIHLSAELHLMGTQARAEGKVYSSCGSTLRSSEAGPSAESQLNALGYGNKSEEPSDEEDEFGPLTFKCTQGHTNHRKKNELLTECQTKPCKEGSVGCG